jgi:Casein kinase II regulatory subunit
VCCAGHPCVPVGQSDVPRSSTVKIYCPKCEDVYYPRSKYQGSILLKVCNFFLILNIVLLHTLCSSLVFLQICLAPVCYYPDMCLVFHFGFLLVIKA